MSSNREEGSNDLETGIDLNIAKALECVIVAEN